MTNIQTKKKEIIDLFANAQGYNKKDASSKINSPRIFHFCLILVLIMFVIEVTLNMQHVHYAQRATTAVITVKPQKLDKKANSLKTWRESLVSMSRGRKVELQYDDAVQWRMVTVRDFVIDGHGRTYLSGIDEEYSIPRYFRMDKINKIRLP